MDRTKYTLIFLNSLLFGLFVTNISLAQHNLYGENIIVNGDFPQHSIREIDNQHDYFFEVSSAGNPWELQSYQSSKQIAAILLKRRRLINIRCYES